MNVAEFSREMPGLAADGPAAEIGAAAELFTPLIGDWRMRTTIAMPGKAPESYEGFWSFRWGLGGYAVYDVIGFRPTGSSEDAPHRCGLTVRIYDLAVPTWRQVWIGVPRGTVLNLQEFAVRSNGNGGIVIDGVKSTLERTRWQFVSIEPRRFAWTGEESSDGGGTWTQTQTIDGER